MSDLRIILQRTSGPMAGVPQIVGFITAEDMASGNPVPAQLHIRDDRDSAMVDMSLVAVESTYVYYQELPPAEVGVTDCSNQKGWAQ